MDCNEILFAMVHEKGKKSITGAPVFIIADQSKSSNKFNSVC